MLTNSKPRRTQGQAMLGKPAVAPYAVASGQLKKGTRIVPATISHTLNALNPKNCNVVTNYPRFLGESEGL